MPRVFFLILLYLIILNSCSYGLGIQDYTTLTPDSIEIYYETQGEGLPIVMIAGGPGGNPAFFKETHKLWQAYGKLVYVHNRGRGLSQKLDTIPDAYSLQKDVEDVEAVRKALGEEKIIVYGHSYGGMVALLYAATYPENCRALITTSTLAGEKTFQEQNIDAVKYFLSRNYPEKWQKIVQLHEEGYKTSDARYESLWPEITELYYLNPETHKIMKEINERTSQPGSYRFNINVYNQIVGLDPEWEISGSLKGVELIPLLDKVSCPSLIIGGRYDRVCPPLVQFQISNAIKDSKIIIFDASGHRPFLEEPLKFFFVTGEFLQWVTRTK